MSLAALALAGLATGFAFLPIPARAAGLPPLIACRAPMAPYRAALCADPVLRVFPPALERLLWMARARVSARGRALLAAGQESFERFLPVGCPLLPRGRAVRAEDRDCIARGFALRFRTVIATGVKQGPFTLQRVESLSISARPAVGLARPYAMHQVAFPRIDGPDTPVTRAWNATVKRTFPPGAGCDSEAVDTGLDYEVGLVTPRWIGLSWNAWAQCDPAQDGTARRLAETWVLASPPRPLSVRDLFRADRPWQAVLAGAAKAAVTEAANRKGYATIDVDEARIAAAATDPERWVLQAKGISFVFSELEIGVGATFLPDVVVPWTALKDVLAPGVP